jgi:hypothetical protein
MGLKQGWAMVSGKPEMLAMFQKWHLDQQVARIFGLITILSALLILFPKTFIAGNFLMANTILMLICLHLWFKDIKAAGIELPFMILNFGIIYLQHPFAKAVE